MRYINQLFTYLLTVSIVTALLCIYSLLLHDAVTQESIEIYRCMHTYRYCDVRSGVGDVG